MGSRDTCKMSNHLRASLWTCPKEPRRLLSRTIHDGLRWSHLHLPAAAATAAAMRILPLEFIRHLTANDIKFVGPRGLVHMIHLLQHAVVIDSLQHVFAIPSAPLVHVAGPDAHAKGP